MAEAPLWFASFSADVKESIKDMRINLGRIESKVDNLQSNVDNLQSHVSGLQTELRAESARITSLSGLVERNLTAATELRAEFKSEIRSIRSERHDTDTCEVLLQGIPSSPAIPSLDDEALVGAVLIRLGLSSLRSHVVLCRPWLPSSAPAGTATGADPQRQQLTSSRGIVFQLVSPTCRDLVIQNSHKLKDVTTSSLFGMPSSLRISLRPLYPRNVHMLYTKACEVSKSLLYSRSYVKNLTVFLRPSINSPPIPIGSPSDFDGLTPAQPPHSN